MLRLIPRLDIKNDRLIKSVNLEGLRMLGDPHDFALSYYEQGADELLMIDCVASLYGRNSLYDILQQSARDIFIPITIGGGIRSVADAHKVLRSGADKVAVNTAAVANPALISELAQHFGSQAVVLSIAAKQQNDGSWQAYTDNGREPTGLEVTAWAQQCVARGAGEVLITSIDREGTRKGYDHGLVKAVCEAVDVPVIASGGMGKVDDLALLTDHVTPAAVAMADILHYKRATVGDLRQFARTHGMTVRQAA
jgi:cyclase